VIAGFPGVSFLSDILTVRPTDVGELLSLVVPVAVFGAAMLWGYLCGTTETRKAGYLFVVMIAILAFFGAFVDLLDRVALFEHYRRQIGFVEDFGEMLIMSGIFAFAISLVWQETKGPVHGDSEVPGPVSSDVNGGRGISCNR
jgi:hypothetical protein